MLVTHVAAGERLASLRQLLQLACDRDALHRGPTGKLGLPAEPVNQRHGAVGSVLAALVEASQPAGKHGLQSVDRPADLDQFLADLGVVDVADPSGEPANEGL